MIYGRVILEFPSKAQRVKFRHGNRRNLLRDTLHFGDRNPSRLGGGGFYLQRSFGNATIYEPAAGDWPILTSAVGLGRRAVFLHPPTHAAICG